MKLKTLFVLFLFSKFTSSQNIFNPVGAEAWSLGAASVTSQNIFSVFNNPAGIANVKKVNGGLYSEQRFLETKISMASLALVIPSKFIAIGFGINHFGYEKFNQQKISLSLAKKLSKQFSLGINFSYFGTNISEQNHAGNFLGELGLLYQPFEKWHLGLFIFNPTQSKYSLNSYDRMPTYSRVGLSFDISDKVEFITEADQTLNQNLILRGGIKYQIHEILSLSMGVSNNPFYLTFGTGIKLKNFKIDFASSFQQVLGISPHLSISFPLSK